MAARLAVKTESHTHAEMVEDVRAPVDKPVDKPERWPGRYAGKIKIAPDFDEMPEEFAVTFSSEEPEKDMADSEQLI